MLESAPGAIPNLRDVGGRPTSDGGWVRERVLFRSVELCGVDAEGVAELAGLGVRTVFDLRTMVERAAGPDRVPEGTVVVGLDVLAGTAGTAPTDFALLLGDPQRAAHELGAVRAAELYQWGYRRLVHSPGAMAGFAQLYAGLARPGSLPALVHCASGKDRTGWAVAALLLLLGVPEEHVLVDYLLSNELLLPALGPMFHEFEAAGGDPAVLRAVAGVRPEYLEAALDEMTQRFGSVERYFSEGLGLDDAVVRSLRTAFVVDGASTRPSLGIRPRGAGSACAR